MNTPASPYSERIAALVSSEMKRQGYTVVSLAEATNIPRITLHRRLRGASWSIDEVGYVSQVLGIRPSTLIRRVEQAAS